MAVQYMRCAVMAQGVSFNQAGIRTRQRCCPPQRRKTYTGGKEGYVSEPSAYLQAQDYGTAAVLCPAETRYGIASKNQKREQTGEEATWGTCTHRLSVTQTGPDCVRTGCSPSSSEQREKAQTWIKLSRMTHFIHLFWYTHRDGWVSFPIQKTQGSSSNVISKWSIDSE